MKVNNERVMTSGEFADKLGIHIKTVQGWDISGKLKARRTLGNRRYYLEEDLSKALGE